MLNALHHQAVQSVGFVKFIEKTMALTVLAFCGLVESSFAQVQVDRPQLNAEEAIQATTKHYLGDWIPRGTQTNPKASKADFVVDLDGHGTHRTVQEAIEALPPKDAMRNKRWVIEIHPGDYRELICAQDKAPFELRGASTLTVRIVYDNYAARTKTPESTAHPCVPNIGATQYGTSGSTSVAIFSDDVVVSDLTIENDSTVQSQAVALTTAGDRIQLERVALLGHQDTFYVRKRQPGARARVHVSKSFIAGDVDFVFGNATLVIEHSELRSRARRPGGYVLAPSTVPADPRGFLVTSSKFTAEIGVANTSVALGRAWDTGVAQGTWVEGKSPNGQAVIRDSELGSHITGWAPSTSKRPFSPQNRMFEFNNNALKGN